jgi:hypothetical protein
MYMYVYTYIHTYIRTHTYIHTYIRICIHTYIHTYMHTCIHTYVYAFINTGGVTPLMQASATLLCALKGMLDVGVDGYALAQGVTKTQDDKPHVKDPVRLLPMCC